MCQNLKAAYAPRLDMYINISLISTQIRDLHFDEYIWMFLNIMPKKKQSFEFKVFVRQGNYCFKKTT